MIDFGIKSKASYGTWSSDVIYDYFNSKNYVAISITDLYSVNHNIFTHNDTLQYINGCEFYCKFDNGQKINNEWKSDLTRLDILFVGFNITKELKDFVEYVANDQLIIQKEFLKGARKVCLQPGEPYLDPASFGKHLAEHKCLTEYVENLPNFDDVYYEFKKAGGGVIFNRAPFIEKSHNQFNIIQKLIDMDLWGLVSFRDESNKNITDIEINDVLEICLKTGLVPIVASGIHKAYDKKKILGFEAVESFAWLGAQILKDLNNLC